MAFSQLRPDKENPTKNPLRVLRLPLAPGDITGVPSRFSSKVKRCQRPPLPLHSVPAFKSCLKKPRNQ